MKKTQTKDCIHCDKEFVKLSNKSQKSWDTRSKFCSRACIRRFYGSNMKGKTHTEEAKEKNRAAHLGENNSCWKGGISSFSNRERNQSRTRIRSKVFTRDNNQCVECNSKELLQMAHIKSWAKHPDLRFEADNCHTLCMSCHYKETFGRVIPSDIMWGFTNITVTG